MENPDSKKARRAAWKVQVFSSFEEADEADRKAMLALSGIERIRILTEISTPNAQRTEPRFRGPYEILDGPPPRGSLPGDP